MAKKPNRITDVLRAAVKADGRPQRRVALEAGVDPAGLWRFVGGERGLTSENVDRLAEALGLELRPKARKKGGK